MPIICPDNQSPRYRVKKVKKKKIRLAFCGNTVIEAHTLKKKALSRKSLGS